MRPSRVLFVCTGNICRSPTAEAVLRKLAEDAGLSERIYCDSAGTQGWNAGRPPDPRAVRVAFRRGYELVALRARQFGPADFHDFDMIIAMDRGHLNLIEAQRPPDARAEVHRLLDFVPNVGTRQGFDVPDPFCGTEADFEHTLDLIEQGVRGLFAALEPDLH